MASHKRIKTIMARLLFSTFSMKQNRNISLLNSYRMLYGLNLHDRRWTDPATLLLLTNRHTYGFCWKRFILPGFNKSFYSCHLSAFTAALLFCIFQNVLLFEVHVNGWILNIIVLQFWRFCWKAGKRSYQLIIYWCPLPSLHAENSCSFLHITVWLRYKTPC